MRRFSSSLAVALAAVFAVSFFAYGELGGADGIVVPYQGRLERGGVAVNGPVTLAFRMYGDGASATPCHSQSFPSPS